MAAGNLRSLLANFTGDSYHWGCHGTAYTVASRLAQDGPVDVLAVERNRAFAPAAVSESSAYGRSAAFAADHPDIARQIDAADRLVINGEGTLHGTAGAGPAALFALIAAAQQRGKQVYLLNHSVYPADFDHSEAADAAYAEALRGLDGIATRDAASQAFYERHGIAATAAFDCLPLFIARRYADRLATPRSGAHVVVTNGVNMTQAVFASIIDEAVARYGEAARIVYLCGSSGPNAEEDVRAVNFITHHHPRGGRVEVRDVRRFDQFLDTIHHARLLITGRFHYVIAALATGTPFVAFGSNTPKTTVVATAHGYDGAFLDPKIPDAAALRSALDAFDGGTKACRGQTPLAELAERAARNFSALGGAGAAGGPSTSLIPDLARAGRNAQLVYTFEDLPAQERATLDPQKMVMAAKAYVAMRRPDEGAELCRQLIERHPALPVAHANRLIALLATGRPEAAYDAALEAEAACPQEAGVLLYAARAANAHGRVEDAIRILEKAVGADPANFPVRLLLSGLYGNSRGNWRKCEEHAAAAVAAKPEDADANRLLGEARLRLGDYGRGFDAYRYRLTSQRLFKQYERPYRYPRWDGKPFDGRLLVMPETEQGVGFELLATTLIPDIERLGIRVVFELSEKLVPFASRLYPDTEFVPFVPAGNPLLEQADIGAQAYFTEICGTLRRSPADFRAAALRQPRRPLAIPHDRPLRIGLSWSTTNPVYGAERTIPLAAWQALVAGLPFPVKLVNLQYGAVDGEIDAARRVAGLDVEHRPGRNFYDDLNGFFETLDTVDAVVSIDNSTVFFAGLVGKPVFMLLPPIAHWIWSAYDQQSIWIGSIEIFRKHRDAGWNDVLVAIRNRLALAPPG